MRKNSKRYLLLGLVLIAAIGFVTGEAAGQDEAAKPNGDKEPAASSRNLLDFIKAGGPVGYVIVALSFAGIALVIEGFIHIKADKLIPRSVSEQFEELAGKKKFSEMLTLCKANDSMISRIIAAALSRGQLGIEAVREAMKESGTREVTRLQQRVGYIGFIASVAPMLGLLGTVTGMISSFNVLGMAKGAARPDELAVGISEAMVTTCMGLVVAVPLMFFHNYFRDRVTRISQEASGQCERLVRIITVTKQAHSIAKTTENPPQTGN
ncbi:MAG: MotA/TolQ/ExbB proton channel family protein [Phycisphaerae bacterium]|nr:MotA/TolQ/ExbB proton channel family protein [Phycisphaerae bacterium]